MAQHVIVNIYDVIGVKYKQISTNTATGVNETTTYFGASEYINNNLDAIYHAEGRYVFEDNRQAHEYFLKDHIGNTRARFSAKNNDHIINSEMTINSTNEGNILETEEFFGGKTYYPFGMAFSHEVIYDENDELKWYDKTNANENDYNYNGKEDINSIHTGLSDYGARLYDCSIAKWTAVDPFAALYPSMSSYNYVLNNPINSIDPDGRLVIFINGNHYDFSGGTSRYWGRFADAVQNHFADYNTLYLDGPMGGSAGIYRSPYRNNRIKQLSARARRNDGYNKGKNMASEIIASLECGETIKLISHSMGSAYGRGFAKALEEEAEKMGITDQKILTLIADFDAFQGGSLENIPNTFTQQFIHISGFADQEDKNADEVHTDKNKKDHSVETFFSDISTLKEGRYKYNKKTKSFDCITCK